VVAVLTLALGIGVNTAMFSVVDGILLESLPYPDASRLVTIRGEVKSGKFAGFPQGLSYIEGQNIQAHATAFNQMAFYQGGLGARIKTDLMPDFVTQTLVSPDFFPLMSIPPLLGKPILPGEELAGGKGVAVVSYRLWQEDFGGDANILGRRFLIDDKSYEVVGVMPKEFAFDGRFGEKHLWLPLIPNPELDVNPEARWYSVIARLKPDATLQQANAQLQALLAGLATAYPRIQKDQEFVASNLKTGMVTEVRPALLTLFAAAGFVLFLACVNISSLLVARAWTRQREVSIRKALGATRPRLILQFLAENVPLAFAGGALGLLLSTWCLRLLLGIAPARTPRLENIHLNATVLWFTFGISVLAVFLFGLAPALHASSRRIAVGLKDGWAGSSAGSVAQPRHFLRDTLVVLEISLALILVLSAALMLRSFEKLIHVETGVRTDHVLTMSASFSDAACGFRTPEKCELTNAEILNRIRSLPGVQHASISQGFALMGGAYGVSDLYVEGAPDEQLAVQGDRMLMQHHVTPGYFETLGIPILEGRDFKAADDSRAASVAIVNQAFARVFLHSAPLGTHIAVEKDKNGNPRWMQIVGIVRDDRDFKLSEGPKPLYYAPLAQGGALGFGNILVRTQRPDPLSLVPEIEKQIWTVDKNAPIQDITTLDRKVSDSVAEPRFQTSLIGSFGGVGLLLAIVGIHGVMSYAVVQQTHEIGVRMALGAHPSDVLRLVVGHGARLALIGIAAGLAVSWGLTRFLRSQLFEITPTDPATFIVVPILLMLVALAACYVPARRATHIDPLTALRHE
jgi:predicted permease